MKEYNEAAVCDINTLPPDVRIDHCALCSCQTLYNHTDSVCMFVCLYELSVVVSLLLNLTFNWLKPCLCMQTSAAANVATN